MPSRRRFLAAGGAFLGTPAIGSLATSGRNATTQSEAPGQWPMAGFDAAGTGHNPDAQPPTDGVRVRWKQPLDIDDGAIVRRSPVVANGTVYATGDELLAVDAASGETEFRADRSHLGPAAVAPARAYRSPSLVFGTPTGPTAVGAGGGLSVAGSRIGLTRWSAYPHSEQRIPMGNERPTPVYGADTVFVNDPRHLLALDPSDGSVRWRARTGQGRPSVRNGTVYTTYYENIVRGYDTDTGTETFAATISKTRLLSVTATEEELVVGTDNGLAGIGYDGDVRWRYEPEDASRLRNAVAVSRDGVAVTTIETPTDRLVGVDTSDGTERWRAQVRPVQTPRMPPLAIAGDSVYVPIRDGGVVAVDLDDGDVRWRFSPTDTQFTYWSPVALTGESLYVFGEDYLYALVEA